MLASACSRLSLASIHTSHLDFRLNCKVTTRALFDWNKQF